MKKVFLFIGILSMTILSAQDITDALQYSQQDILGTARYRGMSGAFGALGGDLSAIHINPAGSAIFLNSFGAITLSRGNNHNDTNYFNNLNTEKSRSLNFNQIGAVFVYNNQNEANTINRLSLGFTYDQTADNTNQLFVSGRSNRSIDSFFLDAAQDTSLDLITLQPFETISELYAFLGENEGYRTQQAFLGHESFLIEATDLTDPNNTSYFSNIASGVFDQEYRIESTGINGKLSINGAVQLDKKINIGANLNMHFINYDKTTEFFEGNNNSGSIINEVIFTNRLSTIGSGISAQIGGIIKASQFRFGASFETPTWYYIEEQTEQGIETYSDINGIAAVYPDVINIFSGYQLQTPAKATGSIALLFKNNGLISLDYSYKDYSSTKFSSSDGVDFSSLNTEIKDNLQAASTIRIGGELRSGNWSYRGGYSYEESPYKDSSILSGKIGLSIGLGYNFGKYKFDIAYDYSEQQRAERFYPNSGFSNNYLVDNYRNNLIFTLGINL